MAGPPVAWGCAGVYCYTWVLTALSTFSEGRRDRWTHGQLTGSFFRLLLWLVSSILQRQCCQGKKKMILSISNLSRK